MSSSATAYVFWGYDLGNMVGDDYMTWVGPSWLEPNEDGGQKDEDWHLGAALGVDPTDYGACLRAAQQHPVELTTYGHVDGEPQWRVVVKASEMEATYECVRIGDLVASLDWRTQLDEFMRLMEIPDQPGQPGWFLTSSYG